MNWRKWMGLLLALVGIIVGFWDTELSIYLMVEALVVYLIFGDVESD